MADSWIDPATEDNPTTGVATDYAWGDRVNACLEFLRNPPTAKVRMTEAQTIAATTMTYLSFDVVDFDNGATYGGAMWSAGSPDRLTIPTATAGTNAGRWLVQGSVFWDGTTSATAAHWHVVQVHDGSTKIAGQRGSPSYAYPMSSVSAEHLFSHGDYARLAVYSSVARDVNPGSYLTLTWLGRTP